MKVGKDPFPRDEVTGLAAFDHIEPLRSHSVVPEESFETPVIGDTGEAESGLQARVLSAPSASNTQRRVDATLPLNLSAMPHWESVDDEDGDLEDEFLEPDELAPAAAASLSDPLPTDSFVRPGRPEPAPRADALGRPAAAVPRDDATLLEVTMPAPATTALPSGAALMASPDGANVKSSAAEGAGSAAAAPPRADETLLGTALMASPDGANTRGRSVAAASRADETLLGPALMESADGANAQSGAVSAAAAPPRADEALLCEGPRGAAPVNAGARANATLSGAPRADATLIGAAPVAPELTSLSELAELVPPPDALDAELSSGSPLPPSALDAMFGASAGWDDEDEATRVHSAPAGRAPLSAALDMEWDEDEPATEMRPFAMFDTPPLAARQDDWDSPDDATSTYLPRGGSGIRSATPTIRASTPPLQTTLPPVQSRAHALSGGRPSPFPTLQKLAAPEPASEFDERDDRDEARASAFDGLVPVPAPELPLLRQPAAPAPERKPLPERALQLPAAASEQLSRFLAALKAGHKPSIAIAASGAVGLVALVLIVRALMPGGVGTAVLEVSPADARVQVDGKPVAGTSSPYTVSELAPGNHEIVVTKPGYTEYRGAFPVSAGANTKLPVIELSANLRDVGFSVRSVPPGAAVWLDGEASGQVTPTKLTGIKPGIHRLALKHEGYSDYELQMFVPEATVLQLPAAELVALPAAPVEPVRPGRRSRRALSADEAEPYSARRTRRSDAVEPERPSRASYTSSYGTRRSRDADGDPERSPRAAADSGKSGAQGTLRLNSRPWAQVTLDGRPIGNTPQQNLQLSPGKHKLQLTNPQLGLSKTVTVNIKAGETLTQVVNLAE